MLYVCMTLSCPSLSPSPPPVLTSTDDRNCNKIRAVHSRRHNTGDSEYIHEQNMYCASVSVSVCLCVAVSRAVVYHVLE